MIREPIDSREKPNSFTIVTEFELAPASKSSERFLAFPLPFQYDRTANVWKDIAFVIRQDKVESLEIIDVRRTHYQSDQASIERLERSIAESRRLRGAPHA